MPKNKPKTGGNDTGKDLGSTRGTPGDRLTVKQAAKAFRERGISCTERMVRWLCQEGRCPNAVQTGSGAIRPWNIPVGDLDEVVQEDFDAARDAVHGGPAPASGSGVQQLVEEEDPALLEIEADLARRRAEIAKLKLEAERQEALQQLERMKGENRDRDAMFRELADLRARIEARPDAASADLRIAVEQLRMRVEQATARPDDSTLMKILVERLSAPPPPAPPMFTPADAVSLVKTLRDVAQPEGVRATDQVVAKVLEVGLGRLGSGGGEEAMVRETWWKEPLANFLSGLGDVVTTGLTGLVQQPQVQRLIADAIARQVTPAPPKPPEKVEEASAPPEKEEPKQMPPWAIMLKLKLMAIGAAKDGQEECAGMSTQLASMMLADDEQAAKDGRQPWARTMVTHLTQADPDVAAAYLAGNIHESFADPRVRDGLARYQVYERERAAKAGAEGGNELSPTGETIGGSHDR